MWFLILCLAVFLFHFAIFEGPAEDYWSTYITAGSMHMANDQVDFVDINQEPINNHTPSGSLKKNLLGQGIATKDQRIGAPIIYSIPYIIFGLAGLRILHALLIVITFMLIYEMLRNQGKVKALIISLVIAFNPLLIYFNRPNANIVGLAALTLSIYLIMRREMLLAGMMFGVLGGIRNIAILFAPAILASRRKLVPFIIGAILLIIPILLWKQAAFGSMLAHPTQFEALDGFRPEFQHSMLGYEFSFNGLFNYPLHEKIIRTPHFPFPNFLSMPLLLIQSFGIILIASMLVGMYYVQKKRFFYLLFIPFLVFLALQENWEELKSSFIILLFPTIAIFMASGLSLRKIPAILTITILLTGGLFALETVHFEKDERWYQRFPHSLTEEISPKLEMDMRLGWQFFYTPETQEEYEQMREKYLRKSLFPTLYNQPKINYENNYKVYNLTTLEIWDYIY
ncbi:MAG: glycosyltransferase family 87 protein [Candidatus Woesearchaeota archaeon]